MTDLITEARELCGRATPGEWHWEGELLLTDAEQFLVLKPYYDNDTDNVSTCVMPDDAAFIARSRTLIPELCDALEKARGNLDAVWARTEKSRTGCRCQNRRKEIYNKMTRNEEMAQMAFDGATRI